MGVRTPLDFEELAALARSFGVAPLVSAHGLAAGSINTLYELQTEGDRYVLRIAEGGRTKAEVAFELALLGYLASAHFPVAPAAPGVLTVRGKPAILFHYVAGEEVPLEGVTPTRLLELGTKLGRLHELSDGFSQRLANRYGPAFLDGAITALEHHPRADAEVRAIIPLLRDEKDAWQQLSALPLGAIHADLFRDNVRFLGDRIAAILDWEMACTDLYALDLAITLNDWTFTAEGHFDPSLVRALVAGYQSQRPLRPEEKTALWPLSRAAAARYTASRLTDFHLSDLPPDRLLRKDWRRYRARLLTLRAMGSAGFATLAFGSA